MHIKGIVHPKILILSSFNQPHVVTNVTKNKGNQHFSQYIFVTQKKQSHTGF